MPARTYPVIEDLPQRIAEKIVVDGDGCWLWCGFILPGGYGQVWWQGSNTAAHRVVYQLLVGEIPPGLELDHLCRVRRCVKPEHLEAVTRSVNLLRGENVNRRKTHCPHDHPYDDENTIWFKGKWRRCRACQREYDRVRGYSPKQRRERKEAMPR